jgi:hypothetical protein
MAYVDNAQQFNDFLVAQYGSGPAVNEIEHDIALFFGPPPFSVDTAQGTGANMEFLSPVSNEISVTTTNPEPLQFVADQNSSAATEDFDVSGTGAIGVILTAPNVDFSLTGSATNVLIFAGTGNDTIDASGATDTVSAVTGNEIFFTGSGNEMLTGGAGSNQFDVNFNEGLETGTTNTISITGGTGDNSVFFNDQLSDVNSSTAAGVTTVDFISGPNAGQDVTLSNVQHVYFQ